MQRRIAVIVLVLVASIGGRIPAAQNAGPQPRPAPGILLENLTWPEAEKALTPDTIVVIPIGAAAKEHGPHLRLKNDFVLAQYFTRRLLERLPVVVAPTVNYHFYPSFVEYPGSTTLRLETARDLLVDICRSLARFGPRRFYALNTGVSTIRALQPAAELLAADGILLRFTDILKVGAAAEEAVRKQEGGTHADEIETSMMLYIDPSLVDMSKAVKDYHPSGHGRPHARSEGQGHLLAHGHLGRSHARHPREGAHRRRGDGGGNGGGGEGAGRGSAAGEDRRESTVTALVLARVTRDSGLNTPPVDQPWRERAGGGALTFSPARRGRILAVQAALTGLKSSLDSGGCPRLSRRALSRARETAPGAVISTPSGLPAVSKSTTRRPSAEASVRALRFVAPCTRWR